MPSETEPNSRRDLLIVAAIVVVGSMLRHSMVSGRPYWVDEAWVAGTLRASASAARWMASPMPALWVWAIRAVPHLGAQSARILPMVLAVAAAVPAYAIGRNVFGRVGGAVTAAAVVLSPLSVARQDLKPYTGDALVALVILWLVVRVESGKRFALAALAFTVVAAAGFSTASLFVSAAGFAALVVVAAVGRLWRRAFELAAVGGSALVVAAVLERLVFLRHDVPLIAMREYWRHYFMQLSPGGVVFASHRVALTFSHIGAGPWFVALPLAAWGSVVLWRHGLRSCALIVPFVLLVAASASVLRIYPFLDLRTGLFAMQLASVLCAVGAVSFVAAALIRSRRVGFAAAIVGAATLLVPAWNASASSIPLENAPAEVAYIDAHRVAGDVIVVPYPSMFGFGYYFSETPVVSENSVHSTIRYRLDYPDGSRIVVTRGRVAADIHHALREALAQADPVVDVWIPLVHASSPVLRLWEDQAAIFGRVEVAPVPGLGRYDLLIILHPRGSQNYRGNRTLGDESRTFRD